MDISGIHQLNLQEATEPEALPHRIFSVNSSSGSEDFEEVT